MAQFLYKAILACIVPLVGSVSDFCHDGGRERVSD